ncbi:MAG: ribosome biogenesis GTPase Der [Chlamydiota bacterium]
MKLAFVGRPNVGKSALFNRIARKKISIVDPEEGVTRDRLYTEAEFCNKNFTLIDTGGISSQSKDPFQENIRKQTQLAIQEADVLIFVVDAQIGPTTIDLELASLLLSSKKRLLLAVNKIDSLEKDYLIAPFHSLGIQNIIGVSALHGYQIAELLELALAQWEAPLTLPTEDIRKVTIIGKPNVGKSTLLNYILQEERSVVSPIPGTTRDAIEHSYIFQNKKYQFVDTAGIRRKTAEHTTIEKFAAMRTQGAIEKADLCLIILDASEGISSFEKKIIHSVEEAEKGAIFLLNKWDKVKGCRMEHYKKTLQEEISFFAYCPMIFLSAKTGRNVPSIFPIVEKVYASLHQKISTSKLNTFIQDCLQKCHPAMLQGKRLRIYYMTQISISPVRFILFVNYPDLFAENYKKFLVNQFRKEFGFEGVPISFIIRKKESTPIEKRHHSSTL